MIYVGGSREWCGSQISFLGGERHRLLKMPYIDQETMCRIAEIKRHMINMKDYGNEAEEIQDVTEKSPLCDRIRKERLPVGSQLPTFDSYDGTTDPEDHLHAVRSILELQNASDALICRVFVTTLRGRARCWYYTMPQHCIYEFKTLARAFLKRFARENRVRKQSDELWYVQQREGESLKDYMARFNDMASDVKPLDDEVAIACLAQGFLKGKFAFPPKSFAEAKERVERHIRGEVYNGRTELNAEPEGMQRGESYTRAEEYDVKAEERGESHTRKRSGYQYRGGRKKGRAGNSYRRNWRSGY